jgi:hypothetical protein
MEDARRLRRSAFWALASWTRLARVAAYSFYELISLRIEERCEGELTAASLVFSALRRFNAMRWRLCWRRWGVTRRWILGALVYGFLPSPFG